LLLNVFVVFKLSVTAKMGNYSNTFKHDKVSLRNITAALSMPSATRKFHDYSLTMPNVNVHHLYLNNNGVIAWRHHK